MKDYKIIWKINKREMKTKLYLETLILLCIKWTGMVEIKHKDFIDIIQKAQDIMPMTMPNGLTMPKLIT